MIVLLRTTELIMSNSVKNPVTSAKSGQLWKISIQFRLRPNYRNPVPVPVRIPFPVAHWLYVNGTFCVVHDFAFVKPCCLRSMSCLQKLSSYFLMHLSKTFIIRLTTLHKKNMQKPILILKRSFQITCP